MCVGTLSSTVGLRRTWSENPVLPTVQVTKGVHDISVVRVREHASFSHCNQHPVDLVHPVPADTSTATTEIQIVGQVPAAIRRSAADSLTARRG